MFSSACSIRCKPFVGSKCPESMWWKACVVVKGGGGDRQHVVPDPAPNRPQHRPISTRHVFVHPLSPAALCPLRLAQLPGKRRCGGSRRWTRPGSPRCARAPAQDVPPEVERPDAVPRPRGIDVLGCGSEPRRHALVILVSLAPLAAVFVVLPAFVVLELAVAVAVARAAGGQIDPTSSAEQPNVDLQLTPDPPLHRR